MELEEITSKGQIIISISICKKPGVKDGNNVLFI